MAHESEHEEGFIDIFRMIGSARIHVRLELGLLSRNLLLEEYPLAEEYVSQIAPERWLLETDVANLHGVGRFIAGLLDDIRIIEPHGLKTYLLDYIDRHKRRLM